MIQGPRISLRQWKDSDYALFAELNADPEIMRFFLKTATHEESFKWAQRIRTHIDDHGWGLLAVDIEDAFAGCTGFMTQSYDAHFTPAKEIAWRLRKNYWGHG